MASFDAKSLFTNIPLSGTFGLCVKNLYRNQTRINSLPKNFFCRLLEMIMLESFFIFDQTFYKQCDDVGMGFPLGPTLANALLCHFEKIWLESCLTQFNKQHKNIAFTSEVEQNGSLSFLDTNGSRENKLVTSVYQKPTFNASKHFR